MYSNQSDAAVIVEAARKNQIVEVDGITYSNDSFSRVKRIPRLQVLALSSIEALSNFISDDIQKVLVNPIILISKSHEVKLFNEPDKEMLERDLVAKVENPLEPFSFNNYMNVENMIIQLQTKFIRNDTVDKLLKLLSSIGTTQDIGLKDNGVSQSISVKRGVSAASLEEVELPKVLRLKPIRIFTECEQVESNFLFRIKQDGDIPYVALMDIDPTEWKLKASESISKKMKDYGITLPIYY